MDDCEIIAGELDLSKQSGLEQRRNIKAYKYHPDYYKEPLGGCINDVCLLYLESPLDLSQRDVANIPIAEQDPSQLTECQISGWGKNEVICKSRYNCNSSTLYK